MWARNLFLLVFPIAVPCFAAIPAINVDPNQIVQSPAPGQIYGFDEGHGNGMVGWTFRLTQPMTITHVGWFDAGADGLSRTWKVGLWQDLSGDFNAGSTRTQLIGLPTTGLSIPGGTSATLDGPWRVVQLSSPLTLPPAFYQLGGLDTASTTDGIKFSNLYPPQPPMQPGFSPIDFFYGNMGNPTTFGSLDNTQFYLAPGVELGPMVFVAPEPSAVALCGGAVIFALSRRRKNNHRKR